MCIGAHRIPRKFGPTLFDNRTCAARSFPNYVSVVIEIPWYGRVNKPPPTTAVTGKQNVNRWITAKRLYRQFGSASWTFYIGRPFRTRRKYRKIVCRPSGTRWTRANCPTVAVIFVITTVTLGNGWRVLRLPNGCLNTRERTARLIETDKRSADSAAGTKANDFVPNSAVRALGNWTTNENLGDDIGKLWRREQPNGPNNR